jgi:hypothetical protein
MDSNRKTIPYLILICCGLYMVNSFIMFHETYVHRVALRAPDKPIQLFIIQWVLSIVVFTSFLQVVIYSRRLWYFTLLASIAIIMLSVMEHFFLFYYSNFINMLLNNFAALLSIYFILRRRILEQYQVSLIWKSILIILIIALFITSVVYMIIR